MAELIIRAKDRMECPEARRHFLRSLLGHRRRWTPKKAGGRIILDKMQKVYGERSIFDVGNLRLCQYLDEGR